MIVDRDGPTVRLSSRNAYDRTERLAAIAAAAELIKAENFTIDGEAVVLGPDGLSRFEELSRREAARTAILYAFDLIELDGEERQRRPADHRDYGVETAHAGRRDTTEGPGTFVSGHQLDTESVGQIPANMIGRFLMTAISVGCTGC